MESEFFQKVTKKHFDLTEFVHEKTERRVKKELFTETISDSDATVSMLSDDTPIQIVKIKTKEEPFSPMKGRNPKKLLHSASAAEVEKDKNLLSIPNARERDPLGRKSSKDLDQLEEETASSHSSHSNSSSVSEFVVRPDSA